MDKTTSKFVKIVFAVGTAHGLWYFRVALKAAPKLFKSGNSWLS